MHSTRKPTTLKGHCIASGASPAQGVVDMSGWLISLIVVAIVVLLLFWRNRGRRGSGRSGGTVDPGERWRTGGYGG
jgi:hypothetical protein